MFFKSHFIKNKCKLNRINYNQNVSAIFSTFEQYCSVFIIFYLSFLLCYILLYMSHSKISFWIENILVISWRMNFTFSPFWILVSSFFAICGQIGLSLYYFGPKTNFKIGIFLSTIVNHVKTKIMKIFVWILGIKEIFEFVIII